MISPLSATHPTSRPSSAWTTWGQWLAVITMTMDHVVRYLLSGSWDVGWVSSSIGRIAFPLFAAMVAWHGLFNTHNPTRYALRILLIGLIAQLPYMAMTRYDFKLNICFTLVLGLCWGTWLRSLAHRSNPGGLSYFFIIWLSIATTLFAWLFVGQWVEYGHGGLLMIPFFMFALHVLNQPADTLIKQLTAVSAALPLLINAVLLNSSIMAKFFTVATCFFVLLMAAGAANRVLQVSFRMPRFIWRAWYPGHLLVIVVLLHWPDG